MVCLLSLIVFSCTTKVEVSSEASSEASSTSTSTITDIVDKGNGTFNMNPTSSFGTIGFRKYKDFILGKGDTANFIFKYGNDVVEKFVILVEDTIIINGLINSVKDSNFCDGQLVFISPNGMVVGASGVLNVGSLSILTPDPDSFGKLIGGPRDPGDFSVYANGELVKGTGTVTINGKVVACDDNITINGVNIK